MPLGISAAWPSEYAVTNEAVRAVLVDVLTRAVVNELRAGGGRELPHGAALGDAEHASDTRPARLQEKAEEAVALGLEAAAMCRERGLSGHGPGQPASIARLKGMRNREAE